ncbi:hypothetical protein ACJZ2D_012744 [Fusarium nematophilum]
MDESGDAVSLAREAVKVRPQSDSDRAKTSNSLATALHSRYLETGSTAEIEEAIRILQDAIDQMPEAHPDMGILLSNLGLVLHARYKNLGELTDLDNAIRRDRDAIKITPEGHLDRATFMRRLAASLGDRYRVTRDEDDLAESIAWSRWAIESNMKGPAAKSIADTITNGVGHRLWSTPDLEPNVQSRTASFDTTSGRQENESQDTGLQVDLEEAIRAQKNALRLTPNTDPDRAMLLSKLGISLRESYGKKGLLSILDEAIEVSREADANTPKDDPDGPERLVNLAGLLSDRFDRIANMVDLEEAIDLGQQAVAATAENSPERSLRLNKLSIKFRARFSRFGGLADLDEAIRLVQEAINITPEHHPDRLIFINNLVTRFGDMYSRTDDIDYLDEAIRLGREVSDRVPDIDPNRAVFLNNLSFMLGELYSRLAELEHLDDAIQLSEAAVGSMLEDDPRRAKFLSNLGNHIGNKYLETMSEEDLEYAIRVSQQAIDATPLDHPDRAMFCNNLGIQLADRYLSTQEPEDLEAAISCYKLALFHDPAPPGARIKAGRDIVRLCTSVSDWDRAYEAATKVMSLVSQLTRRSLEISDKQDAVRQLAGFPPEAAAVAMNAEKDPVVAVKFLEEGRGILAASLEDLRTETIQLQEKHPNLAEQFLKCRDKLEENVERIPLMKSHAATWKPEGSQRYEAGKQFDKLVAEIRQHPGFEDFLLAPNEADMYDAARHGPIIVINVSEFRCDALVVEPHQIRQVDLPDLTVAEISSMSWEYSLGSPRVLRWLWDVVANPILAALDITKTPSSGDTWPHVWWIPTGPLSKFPIHAAGYHYRGSSKTVLDRVMSSYSSSIKALIQCRRRPIIPPGSATKALLLALEQTPGFSSLPFAGKEVSLLRGLCESMGVGVVQPQPRKQDILSQLQECAIFHFAGHGSNHIDPSRSRLVLEDEDQPLLVADLLGVNLRSHAPFLAYLSACGTGEIEDESYSDEGMHLISGCQLAGFRHVIGTLWEVSDQMCVDIARITYQEMGSGGIIDQSVSFGLHNAVREMRDQWLSNRKVKQGRKRGGNDEAGDGGDDEDEDGGDLEGAVETRNAQLMGGSGSKTADKEPLRWVPYVHYGV